MFSDLTYLRLHDVVLYNRRLCRIAKINDCRALVVPIKKQTQTFTPQTGENAGKKVTFTKHEDGDGISPNSPLEILGTWDPATGAVKWRGNCSGGLDGADTAPLQSEGRVTPSQETSNTEQPTPNIEPLQQTELL